MNSLLKAAIGAATMLGAGPALATTITFSSATAGSNVSTYAEGGYTLAVGTATSTPFIKSVGGNNLLDLPGATTFDLTGGLFTLGSFTYGNTSATNLVRVLQVTGYRNGVQVFSGQTDAGTGTLAPYDLQAGATVFDRVRFASQAFGDVGIDNITANAVAGVPEPASWAMMMLGFGGLGYAMRRKSRVSTRIRFA